MDRRTRPPDLHSPTGPGGAAHTRILTIARGDYFHAAPFRAWICQEMWYRFEKLPIGRTRRVPWNCLGAAT